MRASFTFCVTLLLFSCANAPTNTESKNKQISFNWILGSWIRINETSDNKTFENWKKKSSEEYIGFGYSLNNGDTVFQENLRILNTDKSWNLEVTGKNEAPVLFSITDHASEKFTAVK